MNVAVRPVTRRSSQADSLWWLKTAHFYKHALHEALLHLSGVFPRGSLCQVTEGWEYTFGPFGLLWNRCCKRVALLTCCRCWRDPRSAGTAHSSGFLYWNTRQRLSNDIPTVVLSSRIVSSDVLHKLTFTAKATVTAQRNEKNTFWSDYSIKPVKYLVS